MVAKRVLMIAYHFPPARASGVQRTVGFCRHLPEFGWEPVVLSAHPRAYVQTDPDRMAELSPSLTVRRAFALDAARHLSLWGKYARITALPDRWSSWWLGAVPAGLLLIRRHRPRVIWSTYPIASSLLIGLTLHRLTGLPWVADFRDPMVIGPHPLDPAIRKAHVRLERWVIDRCSRAVVSTPGIGALFADRYPKKGGDHFQVIANGYDEAPFQAAERALKEDSPAAPDRPITLLHSGTLYPGDQERDPGPFLAVLAQWLKEHSPGKEGFHRPVRVLLRATGNDAGVEAQIRAHGLEGVVRVGAPLPHARALAEMMRADGLLLFQGAGFKHLIPAKLFEYVRSRRPILALVDPEGQSANLLREAGITTLAPLRDRVAIGEQLQRLLQAIQRGQPQRVAESVIKNHSRQVRTGELAQLLDRV